MAVDNTLWAWGWNEHANTGTGAGDAVFHPTLVPLETTNHKGFEIQQIFAGGGHNFIVTTGPDKIANEVENKKKTDI